MSRFIKELKTVFKYLKIKNLSKKIVKQQKWSIVHMFNDVVKKYPNRYIKFNKRLMTYKQLDELSNQIASWAKDMGIKKGDVVPLMMYNRPEYIATWLGLCKIGASAGLISETLNSLRALPGLVFSNLKNISWPDAQSARSTISWTIVTISGLVITCPAAEAGIPFQSTEAVVEVRLVISKLPKLPVNKAGGASIAAASPTSWPTIVVLVVLVCCVLMVKSINALPIVVP